MITSLSRKEDMETLQDIIWVLEFVIRKEDTEKILYWNEQMDWWQERIQNHDYTKEDTQKQATNLCLKNQTKNIY